jgi:hypothetical protein
MSTCCSPRSPWPVPWPVSAPAAQPARREWTGPEIALSATATYLIAHHTSPLAPAIAATHGYTVAFWVSTGLLGLGFILTTVLLPSRRRLAEVRDVRAATPAAPGPPPAPATPAATPARPAAAPPPRAAAPVPVAAAPAQQRAAEAIPVALCSCSPVIRSLAGAPGARKIPSAVLPSRESP